MPRSALVLTTVTMPLVMSALLTFRVPSASTVMEPPALLTVLSVSMVSVPVLVTSMALELVTVLLSISAVPETVMVPELLSVPLASTMRSPPATTVMVPVLVTASDPAHCRCW